MMNVFKIDGQLRSLSNYFGIVPGSLLLCARSGNTSLVAIMCNSPGLDLVGPRRRNISVTLANPRRQRPELPGLAQKAELRVVDAADFTIRESFAFGRSMLFEAVGARCRSRSKIFPVFCLTV